MVRTYRLEIRLIQLSVFLTVIVMIFGFIAAWSGTGDEPEAGTGSNLPVQANGSESPEGSAGGQNNDLVLEGTNKPLNTKIVCLGDSFTYGYPGKPEDSWPKRVSELLKIEVVNAGKVYQNATDLLDRFDEDVVAEKPGRVIIFAGVGDALREIPLEDYRKNLMALVEKAQSNHIRPVIALPIPYPGAEKLINSYREWEIEYAREKNITVLDFKEVLFGDDGKILREYSDDGKYPNKDGYEAMGDYAARVLQ